MRTIVGWDQMRCERRKLTGPKDDRRVWDPEIQGAQGGQGQAQRSSQRLPSGG